MEQAQQVTLRSKGGEINRIPADAIFMGLGRELNFDSLELEKAGIRTENGAIVLNNRLQTSNRNVYVSGDAANNVFFSHAAEMHNMLLIRNFLSPKKQRLDLDNFSWVTFTDPEVATFGLNEKKLKERKIKYERLEISLEEADRAVTNDFEDGRLLLFIEKKRFNPANAKILGGSMVAPNAGEIVQELILAKNTGVKVRAVMNKIYPYPTAANIHKVLIRRRITGAIKPWMKRILKIWYRL